MSSSSRVRVGVLEFEFELEFQLAVLLQSFTGSRSNHLAQTWRITIEK